MTHAKLNFRRAALLSLIISGAVLIAVPSAGHADNWRVASNLDAARVSVGASSGTISLNDGGLFSVLVNVTEWFAVAPYAVAIDGPKSDMAAVGFGVALRLQTPFGTRAYRLFWESYFGGIRGDEVKNIDGVDVDTDFRYQALSLAGVEFQVWKRLTWSFAVGEATAEDDLSAIHPRLNSNNFTAQTTARWYF